MYYKALLIFSTKDSFCWIPTIISIGAPSLNKIKVGILWIPNFWANSNSSSTFTFPTTALSPISAETSSNIGICTLQGPHHSAQKSTRVTPFEIRII